jgi:myo-inositol 2-dehydrogenase/D-chiro-inositol 1-dehydrogenase/scyllo-inositol 2-dehydrogenase (NAD+)
MQKMVRVCLVGCGRAGKVHAHNLSAHLPQARLVSVVDTEPEPAKELAQELEIGGHFTSLAAAFDSVDCDAVVITTPTFTHASLIIAAAQAGKHVFSEKPLCVTLEEADQIGAALDRSGVTFQIGLMRRFDRSFLHAKRLLDEGAIGKPLLVKSVGRGPGLPPAWYADPKKSNGLLAEVNSHDFDAMRWLMGREFKRAFAVAGNFKCPEYKAPYPDFYDTVTVNLTFDDGTLGLLDGCCPATYGYDARMEVLGTEGMIQVGSTQASSVVTWNRNTELVAEGNRSWRTLFREAYLAEMECFVDCILNGKTPPVGLDAGRKALEAVLAANASIRTGQPVDVGRPA